MEGVKRLSRGIQRTGTMEIDLDGRRGDDPAPRVSTEAVTGGVERGWSSGEFGPKKETMVIVHVLEVFHETIQFQ